MLGTHNQGSVERAVRALADAGLDPTSCPVYFASLMGMSDNLAFTLGSAGYRAYKYVPYGSVAKCVPYLLRRAHEAQYASLGGKADARLVRSELLRRLRAALPFGLGGGSGSGGEHRASSA